MKLRVMSMNLRNSGAKDGKNVWNNRKGLVREILESYQPDIIGFQEALSDQMRDLTNQQHEAARRQSKGLCSPNARGADRRL